MAGTDFLGMRTHGRGHVIRALGFMTGVQACWLIGPGNNSEYEVWIQSSTRNGGRGVTDARNGQVQQVHAGSIK